MKRKASLYLGISKEEEEEKKKLVQEEHSKWREIERNIPTRISKLKMIYLTSKQLIASIIRAIFYFILSVLTSIGIVSLLQYETRSILAEQFAELIKIILEVIKK